MSSSVFVSICLGWSLLCLCLCLCLSLPPCLPVLTHHLKVFLAWKLGSGWNGKQNVTLAQRSPRRGGLLSRCP